MWSTCSIATGHSCTHAPQVTQSQTTSSLTAFGTSGVGSNASPPFWAASRLRALGEELVAEPHDQELRRQLLAGRVGGADVLAAAALGARHRVHHLLPGQVGDGGGAEAHRALVLDGEVERLEPAAPAGAAEPDVDRGGRDVEVLRVREIREEADDEQRRAPRRAAARAPRPRYPSPNSCAIAFESGDQPAGHSFSPVAIRAACQSNKVSTISAIRPRIRSASPRWLPLKRSGRCTLRIQNAAVTPTSTSTTKRSTRSANQPWCPSHGRVAPFATAAISAITIVGNRTRKPQKMSAWIRPGAEPLEQLLLPEHDDRLVADPRGARRRTAAPACPSGRAGTAAAPGGRTAGPLSRARGRAQARKPRSREAVTGFSLSPGFPGGPGLR